MEDRKVRWSVMIDEDAREWIYKTAKEQNITVGAPVNDLYAMIRSGDLTYKNHKYISTIEDTLDTRIKDTEIERLQTALRLAEAKIRGLEEQNANSKREKPIQETTESIKREPIQANIDGINLKELIRLATKHRITEQSLLDMALRPYR